MERLSLASLKLAVEGKYAAIRRVTRLEPVGEKIFPPTYLGGKYAEEQRQVRTETATQPVETVLLDSVQSQANRMEMALLRAYDAGRLKMPLLQVDFAGDRPDEILSAVGRLTALEAPHRWCDAIFWDAIYKGERFRQSTVGRELNSSKTTNATAVFAVCPTALIFGYWDSNARQGAGGARVQRALFSEIVGYQKVSGKRTSSRIDPLQIDNSVEIYAQKGGGWIFSPAEAEQDKSGPVKIDPSAVIHGNIPPTINDGGVTMAYAEQQTVISLAALRRLRFPVSAVTSANIDNAARTVLAALGLAAICFLDEEGYDLRSRCLLDGKPGTMQFVGRGETYDFSLDADGAASLLAQAANEAKNLNLPWSLEPVTLQPSAELSRLVVESRKKSMSVDAGK